MKVSQRNRVWLKVGASAGALALAAAGGAARAADAEATAQSPADQSVSEVVVTGFRSSLAKAIELKREDVTQTDTILAEDIGKFPDLNLAESLQRIPGVTITREGGEGRQITVRGLGPQYTRTRINGMEALTTIGSPDNDGGVNRTRSFDFTVFASDLFNSLSVHKTAEGDVDEGSLGATVDLHTARPFDFNRPTLILSGKGDYNQLSGTVEPRLSAMAANTWADGKFGALVSLSYSKRNFLDVGASTVRWDQANVLSTGGTSAAPLVGFGSVLGTNCQAYPLPAACVATDSALHPRFPRYDYYQNDQSRFGATLSLQWRPDDASLFTLDFLHSYWKATREEQYLEAPGFSGTGKCTSPATCTSIANIAVTQETINSQGVLVSGTFNGVDTRVEDRFDLMHTNFNQVTFAGEHKFTDAVGIDGLVGYSSSDFQNPIQTTVGYDQFNVQGFQYDYSNGKIPMLNFGSADLTANGPWVLTSVRERPQGTKNTFLTGQFNAHWTMNEHFKLSGGVSYKEYKFSTTSLRLVNGESVTATNAYASLRSIPISTYVETVSMANAGVNIPTGSTATWAAPNAVLAAQALGLYTNSALFALSIQGDLGNNAGVTERDLGAYVQGDFNFDLAGRPLKGNVGGREVRTGQSSTGYLFISGVQTPVNASRVYHEFLPSLNLSWELTHNLQVRFSAARVMTRPNLTDLVASTSVSVSGTSYSVKTGNPNLKPFLANAYDVALEWYPGSGSLVSLALFRKDIVSLVTSNVQNIPFHDNPFGIPDSAAIAACGSTPGCSPAATWSFSTPTNTAGGQVNGLELNVQQPFTFLPGILRHTGALANFTYVTSSVLYPSGSGFVSNQLLGLSKYAANATLYYEDEHWSARVSGAFRTKYLIRVPGQETGTDADGFDRTFNLDASVQYTVNPHIKLTVEGVNLTDQYESEFNDTVRDLPYYYHHTGREILFGVRYQY
ncbi:MAG: TonB-dependent receptor [Proteobacteria bacterium]|nr:TonB-dependent receptor [Pseudomonadota bacterium]